MFITFNVFNFNIYRLYSRPYLP